MIAPIRTDIDERAGIMRVLVRGTTPRAADGTYGDFGVDIVTSWEGDRVFWHAWRATDHE